LLSNLKLFSVIVVVVVETDSYELEPVVVGTDKRTSRKNA